MGVFRVGVPNDFDREVVPLTTRLPDRFVVRTVLVAEDGDEWSMTRVAYDLVGEPISAAGIAESLGVAHRTIGLGEYRAQLLADEALLPFQPPMLASIATSVRHGFLSTTSHDLAQLLGRPITDPLTVATDTAAAMRPDAS
ncbi:hypothetical protein [Streptomyces mayteni]